MIKGLGNDIVKIDRIETMISKYGEQFLGKIFTENERTYCEKKRLSALHFAGRWAVKEAFYKALPKTCQKDSSWQSIETVNDADILGAPKVYILSEKLQKSMADHGISETFVTISHEQEYCVSTVILV